MSNTLIFRFALTIFILTVIQSTTTFSQVTLITDSINSDQIIGFKFKSDNSDENQIIFDKKCLVASSSDFKKIVVKKSDSPINDTAVFTIYNDSGIVENRFKGPNFNGILIRNDGATIIHGDYFTYSIQMTIHICAFDSDGKLITSFSNTFGYFLKVKIFDNENRILVFADSSSGELIERSKYVLIFDRNFNLISKHLFDDNHSKHFFNFDYIDEQKRFIHFFYSDRANKRVEDVRMTFSGDIIK